MYKVILFVTNCEELKAYSVDTSKGWVVDKLLDACGAYAYEDEPGSEEAADILTWLGPDGEEPEATVVTELDLRNPIRDSTVSAVVNIGYNL